MIRTKTLFIGCGDGREIIPLVSNQEHLVIGLEPSDQMYKSAVARLKGFPKVILIQQRIQDWKCAEHEGSIDQIYFIFPPPRFLRFQAEEIISKVHFLLSEEGTFNVYTEVTKGWPDPVDTLGLQEFLRVLQDGRFSVAVIEIGLDQLPEMAKQSHCGILFPKHNLNRFAHIQIKKG